MFLPSSIERLTLELSKLPGVGRKTAQRLAFNILRYTSEEAENLAQAIRTMKQQVRHCVNCFALTDTDTCLICSNPQRNQKVLCVVEQPANVFTIERSRVFQGAYHVLMGAISPLDGIGPEQITFRALQKRIEMQGVEELIIATNPSLSGEATALFLLQEFQSKITKITRLARGLPAGGDLEYVDDITLIQAFSGRHFFDRELQ